MIAEGAWDEHQGVNRQDRGGPEREAEWRQTALVSRDESSTSPRPPLEVRGFCKNARIHTSARLVDMLLELRDLSWKFVCFSETRATPADNVLNDGHRLITHCGEAYVGVGI